MNKENKSKLEKLCEKHNLPKTIIYQLYSKGDELYKRKYGSLSELAMNMVHSPQKDIFNHYIKHYDKILYRYIRRGINQEANK